MPDSDSPALAVDCEPWIDGEEAAEADSFIAECVRHDPARNCQASLPDCARRMHRLPELRATTIHAFREEWALPTS